MPKAERPKMMFPPEANPKKTRRLALGVGTAYVAVALPAMMGSRGFDLLALAGGTLLGAVLVILTIEDLLRFRLADRFTLPLIVAGLLYATLALGAGTGLTNLLAAGVALLALYAIDALYRRWRGQVGLGLGDAKLFAAAGAWTGLEGLASVLLLACALGLAGVAVLALIGRKVEGSTAVPFGPMLAAALWIVWLYGSML